MPIHVFAPAGGTPAFRPAGCCVGFDLDGTLVFSMSGRRYAAQWGDCLPHPQAAAVIQRLHDTGCNVFIATNQANPQASIMDKLQQAATHFGVEVIAAVGRGCAERKPSPAIWHDYCRRHGAAGGQKVIFCGDAAGPKHSGGFPAYEWNDTDYGFAQAIGAAFYRPEQLLPLPPLHVDAAQKQVVLLMGPPGVGKTRFAAHLIQCVRADPRACEWVVVEQDEHKTRKSVLSTVWTALIENKSVLVDATHPRRTSREEVYRLADVHRAPVQVCWLARDGRRGNELRERKVPEVAYNVYAKNFEDPRADVPARKVNVIV